MERGKPTLPLVFKVENRKVNQWESGYRKQPLGIPAMKNRAMQALYQMALDPVTETICDNNVYGFRKARSTADAIEEVFNTLSMRNSAKWVLEGDIKGCFSEEYI
jgi:RNA-directed DNA polymerase